MEQKGKEIYGEEYHAFIEPRTIPAGWDVSAFFAPEQDRLRNYGMLTVTPKAASLSQETYEHT